MGQDYDNIIVRTWFEGACFGVGLVAGADRGRVFPDLGDEALLVLVSGVGAAARALALECAANVGVLARALYASAGRLGRRARDCVCVACVWPERWLAAEAGVGAGGREERDV